MASETASIVRAAASGAHQPIPRVGFLTSSPADSLPCFRPNRARPSPLSRFDNIPLAWEGMRWLTMLISIIQLQREVRLRQQHVAAVRSAHEQIIPKIEMLVGAWYLDQFGNRTREIKARD